MEFDLSPAIISLKVSLTATTIIFFSGLAVAWLMYNYHGRFLSLLDGMITLPMVLPPTVVGLGLLILIGKNGPIGIFLDQFNIHIIFSWYAAVIAAVVVAFPLMYKTTKGAFEQIDPNLIAAARTLGVSEWKIFWKITVPLAWPGIAAATTLSFARSLGEFGATLMVAGSIPGQTETIPVAIYFATQGSRMDVALWWALLIFIISLVAIAGMNYWNQKTEKRHGIGHHS